MHGGTVRKAIIGAIMRSFACGHLHRKQVCPSLRGRKPFGGHILSHDFVEAALMRRAGWAIYMAPSLGGSFEEVPPSILDFAARDRRWCQGNLQHIAVLPARGLHWVSRLHLMTGIGSYLTAPLWLVFLVLGLLISLQAHFVRPEYFPKGFSLFPTWPAQDPVLAAWVFAATMGLLIVPKLLAYLVLISQRKERVLFGGRIRVLAGILVETVLAAMIAPSMMIFQSGAVAEILFGRDAGIGRCSGEAMARLPAGRPIANLPHLRCSGLCWVSALMLSQSRSCSGCHRSSSVCSCSPYGIVDLISVEDGRAICHPGRQVPASRHRPRQRTCCVCPD